MFQSVTRRGENAALFIILEYIFKQLNESLSFANKLEAKTMV